MASERFGTGFFFARQLSTAAIISSPKPMIFLTGCVSGRPIISHMPNRLPHISHISNRQARGSVYFRPGSWPRLPEKTTTTTKWAPAPDPILKLVVTASLAAAFEDEVAIRELIGDRNCCDPYFHAPLRFQERECFLGQGWGFRSVDDVDPVCRREAKQIKAVIRDTCRR